MHMPCVRGAINTPILFSVIHFFSHFRSSFYQFNFNFYFFGCLLFRSFQTLKCEKLSVSSRILLTVKNTPLLRGRLHDPGWLHLPRSRHVCYDTIKAERSDYLITGPVRHRYTEILPPSQPSYNRVSNFS